MSALVRVDPENAVVSHESALQLHGLSEVAPNVHEFTLPRAKRYRGSRMRHPTGVKIHTAKRFDPEDVVKVGGIRVTSPARSIVDAGNDGTDPKLVRSAVFDALRKLKATPSQIVEAAEKSAEPAVRRAIEDAVTDATRTEAAT